MKHAERKLRVLTGAITCVSIVAVVAGGCAVGPNHKVPTVETPNAHRVTSPSLPYGGAAAGADGGAKGNANGAAVTPEQSASLSDLPWWKVFPDETLHTLLRQTLERNLDLRVAAARTEVARQRFEAAHWALFPTLGGLLGAGGAKGFPFVPGPFPASDLAGVFGASAVASWEVDVWGRLRRNREAEEAAWQATEEDRRGVYIGLVAAVAQGYFRLRTLDWQLQLSEKALAMRQATLSLFQDRLKGGVGSDVEVARAEANVRDVEAQMATLRQAIVQAENALAFFSAKPPAATARGKVGIEALALPPQVPAGLPSALLTRRPDVRSAERELAAANARVGVVTAEYFPKFDLTGSLGFLTNDLARITTSGATDLVWRSAGQMSWMAPIFGGATLNAKMAAAKAAWEGAKAAYERAALNSFREVSDALIAIGELDNAHRARVAQVAALDRAVVSAETRFRGGVANYLEVVQAQELQLVAQLALAGVRGSQFSALVDLYRALGGGWTPPKES